MDSKRTLAEFISTFLLVMGGCGCAVLSAAFSEVGIELRQPESNC